MNLLKRLFQSKFCEKCYYQEEFFKYEALKSEYLSKTKKQKEIESIQSNFLNNINSLVPNNEAILFISVDINSPLILITLKTDYDVRGRIKEFTLRGYTNEYLEKPIIQNSKELMHIEPVFEKVGENESEEYIHHFFIIDFPCTPNMGYGSLMMRTALDYLKQFKTENNKIYITGWLSFVDKKSHNERLHHFYKKFGFDFTFNSKGDEYIIKYL